MGCGSIDFDWQRTLCFALAHESLCVLLNKVKWSKDVGCVSVLHVAQKLPRTSPKLSEQRAQHKVPIPSRQRQTTLSSLL